VKQISGASVQKDNLMKKLKDKLANEELS